MIYLNNSASISIVLLMVILLVIERVKFNIAAKRNILGKIYSPWLTHVPFATYILIVLLVLWDGFIFRGSLDPRFSAVGLALYSFGIYLRRASRRALGQLWSMHIEIKPKHRIVRSGIYRHLGHPYSIAVMCELLGFSLIFRSWIGCIAAIVIQGPLLLLRNRTEEKVLQEAILDSKLQKGSILDVIRQFGLGGLFEFIAINNAMKHYNRYYMLTSCMMALLNVGFFDEFHSNQSINIRTYSKEKVLDFTVLNTICAYLMSQGFLEKRGKMIRLTHRGRFLSDKCKGIFDFVSAYEPIFDNLEEMLRGKVKYGRDIFRRGKYVATASAHLAKRFTFPVIKSVIANHGFKSVLDLGCGSGEFLETLTNLSEVRLFGIDISKEAIDYARMRLNGQNIQLEECDLFDLRKLKRFGDNEGNPPSVITSVFVFHELASDGFANLTNYLKGLRTSFPDSNVLIYELFQHKWHRLKRISSAIREHHLFHYLSNQALLSIGNWQNVIRDSGYVISEQKVFEDFGQGYFLLRP